jgi:hypothetical protein
MILMGEKMVPTRTEPGYQPQHRGKPGLETPPWRQMGPHRTCAAQHCNHGTGQ